MCFIEYNVKSISVKVRGIGLIGLRTSGVLVPYTLFELRCSHTILHCKLIVTRCHALSKNIVAPNSPSPIKLRDQEFVYREQ